MSPDGRSSRPWVTVKFAQTLDGRIATSSGDGARRISGPASLKLAHELRAQHDAILVGVETVIADNPLLTVRLVPGSNPLRVVADSRARSPLSAALFHDEPGNTLVAHTPGASPERLEMLQALNVGLLKVSAGGDGRLDLRELLRLLRARGITSLMVEGGAMITTALLRERLVDRLIVCVAPKLVGRGVSSIGDLGIDTLDEALVFRQLSVRQLGGDVIFDAVLTDAALSTETPARA